MRESPDSKAAPAQGSFLAGLALVTSCLLALEVLDTRLLSVLTWYSLAFLVIAMGLFGLTAGAVHVYLNPERWSPERLSQSLARELPASRGRHSGELRGAVGDAAARRAGGDHGGFVHRVLGSHSPALLPRRAGGGGGADPLAVSRWSGVRRGSGRRGLGAPLVPLALHVLDGGSAILAFGVLAAFAAVFFARSGNHSRLARTGLFAAVALAGITAANAATDRGLEPLWVKGRAESREHVVRELWNSHSRVQLLKPAQVPAAMWGGGQEVPRSSVAAAGHRDRRPRGDASVSGRSRLRKAALLWSATSRTWCMAFARRCHGDHRRRRLAGHSGGAARGSYTHRGHRIQRSPARAVARAPRRADRHQRARRTFAWCTTRPAATLHATQSSATR